MSDRPFRICFNALFLQNHLGGIGNYCYHLVKGIRARNPGWKLALLVHAGVARHFRDIEGLEIIVVDIKSRNGRLAFFHLRFPFMVRRFDLLHSVGNMGMAFCPVPQVISIMDTYEHVSPERFSWTKRKLMTLLISHSGGHAARVIAISQNTKRDISRYYPHLAGKVEVVYCGNKFPVAENAAFANRAHFIFVGTLEPGKNLDHALRAFARFGAGRGHRLRVVGAMGWNQTHIPGLLDSLGIREQVDFLGYVGDGELRGYYASAIALLQASSYEGFGLPVIEGMACGCPVIAARNSALVEAGGDAALFFETGDVPALAAWMDKLATDPALGLECVRKGLLHAKRFTWEDTAASTGAIFQDILGP